jgi:hypothetical protein
MTNKWIDFAEWQHLKEWYREAEIAAILHYLEMHKGIYDQVKEVENNPGKYGHLTLDQLNKFLLALKWQKIKN